MVVTVVRVVVGVVVVVVVVGVVVVVVVVVVVGVVVVVVVGVVVLLGAVLAVVVGVTVVTVVWPLLPVTVTVCGDGGGTGDGVPGSSPGFVTRVVVVVGLLSVVRVTARPPTAIVANTAAMPNSSGGRRYQGSAAGTRSVAGSRPGPEFDRRTPVGHRRDVSGPCVSGPRVVGSRVIGALISGAGVGAGSW